MARKIFLLIIGLILVLSSCAEDKLISDQDKLKKVYSMFEEYQKGFKTVSVITIEEIKNCKKPITMIDVRDKVEQEVSMIPAAITKEEFEKDKNKYKNTLIVTYCTIGYRSGAYAEELIKQGFDAKNLKGSILAWVLCGEPVLKDGKEVLAVHVYSEKWNILPIKYKGVW